MTIAYNDRDRIQLTTAHVDAERARYAGEGGRGMVVVTMDGLQKAVAVKLDPRALKTGRPELLEQWFLEAVNNAHQASMRALAEQMASLQGALGVDLDALSGKAPAAPEPPEGDGG